MGRIFAFCVLLIFAFGSIASVNGQVQTPQNKKPANKVVKKKEVTKPVVKDTVNQNDIELEPEDTIDVSFGKNIVNLRTFNGWALDDHGKWISSPNRIPFSNPEYNNALYTKYNLGYDNIRQINVIEMKVDGVPYLGILFEQYKEVYKNHPDSIFRSYIGADYFLIKSEDFLKLWNDKMKMGKTYEIDIKAEYSGLVGYRDIKKRPEYIASEINKGVRNRITIDTSVKTYLQFGFLPIKTPKGSFMRFYYVLEYAHQGEAIRPFNFNIFKGKYYEASLDLFHQFAKPKSLVAELAKSKPKAGAQKPGQAPARKKHVKKPDDF